MVTFLKLGKHGRFGNQLFQIASTIGIATQNGHQFAFPFWFNHDQNFRTGGTDGNVQEHFARPLPLIPRALNFEEVVVEFGFSDIKLGEGDFSIFGHLQSERYFRHCPKIIRAFFTPRRPVESPLGAGTCAVHIRLGDYDGKLHLRMGADYYRKAMALLPGGTRFVVFSDEPDAAHKLLGPNHEYVTPSQYISDFFLMATAEHNIIGNSSYSWWAAWLNANPDKIVISPKTWFGSDELSTKDINCEGWRVI